MNHIDHYFSNLPNLWMFLFITCQYKSLGFLDNLLNWVKVINEPLTCSNQLSRFSLQPLGSLIRRVEYISSTKHQSRMLPVEPSIASISDRRLKNHIVFRKIFCTNHIFSLQTAIWASYCCAESRFFMRPTFNFIKASLTESVATS